METKTSFITARIEPGLKKTAEHILHDLGVSTTDAIIMFLKQVTLQKGLPFDVRLPNKATSAAMKRLRSGKGTIFKGNTKELVQNLLRK